MEIVICPLSAHCNMILADMSGQANLPQESRRYTQKAEEIAKMYKTMSFKNSTSECFKLQTECQNEIPDFSERNLHIPKKLAAQCHFTMLSFLLFFCKNMDNWPKTVKDLLSIHMHGYIGKCIYSPCHMEEYKEYHFRRGVNVSALYPDWVAAMERTKMAEPDYTTEHESEDSPDTG